MLSFVQYTEKISTIEYCCIVECTCTVVEVVKFQKHCAHLIFDAKPSDSFENLFSKTKLASYR